MFHINALRRAGKSKLRTHDKVVCLGQHFFFLRTFHFTSSVCLCVRYKMKPCTQISDSGFRGKINVVSSGESAKRGSPGRRAWFSPCKREVKSSPLTRASPTQRVGPPPCMETPNRKLCTNSQEVSVLEKCPSRESSLYD